MMRNKKNELMTVILLVGIIINIMLIITGGGNEILIKLGLKSSEVLPDWTLESWKHSLSGMNFDSDIVFFGDSVTSNGNWNQYFP